MLSVTALFGCESGQKNACKSSAGAATASAAGKEMLPTAHWLISLANTKYQI